MEGHSRDRGAGRVLSWAGGRVSGPVVFLNTRLKKYMGQRDGTVEVDRCAVARGDCSGRAVPDQPAKPLLTARPCAHTETCLGAVPAHARPLSNICRVFFSHVYF